ncbi:hypothetical protein M0R45_008144 [Rubus argutus]|uniref:Uncharacterized protein n=1 Tax=Rubus argutus TaxID=59490 RepID=A0AAW1Y390_RUBAR
MKKHTRSIKYVPRGPRTSTKMQSKHTCPGYSTWSPLMDGIIKMEDMNDYEKLVSKFISSTRTKDQKPAIASGDQIKSNVNVQSFNYFYCWPMSSGAIAVVKV